MSSFTIGGSVTGLSASGLVLQDNGGDNLTVSSGASMFTFSTKVSSGAAYAVTVYAQPTGETCTVTQGTGTATANVTSVSVACTVNTYSIGGSVTGLNTSTSVVLQDNGTDNLTVSSTGKFTFPTKLSSGTAYNVTVYTQPTGQTCTVSQGTGTATANVTSVSVACTTNTYTVAGTISGLSTAGLKLQDYTNGEILPVPAGATKYQFTQSVAYGTNVQVKVTAQPAFETCKAGNSNFSGPITSNITTDTFSCATVTTATVSTFATTSVNSPAGVAVDSSGNVYVANRSGNDILLITPGGTVSVLAGNGTAGDVNGTTAAGAEFNSPTGVAVSASGTIYVADFYNNQIRQIVCTGGLTAGNCQVSLLAGAGPTGAGYVDATGSGAKFYNPLGVAVGPSGNIYVADFNNNAIREVTPSGVVTTVAGSSTGATGDSNGSGSSASFNGPAGVAVDSTGNVYVADEFNNQIRVINSSGVVSTLAGSSTGAHGYADGTGSAASFYEPIDVAVDSAGNVYVADYANNEIRLVAPTGLVSTLAGSATATPGLVNGPASTATFDAPSGVAVNASGDVFVGDQNDNAIREIVP